RRERQQRTRAEPARGAPPSARETPAARRPWSVRLPWWTSSRRCARRVSALHRHVAHHLEVRGGAEPGAVVGVGAPLLGEELERLRLTRLERQVDVEPRQGE